MSSGKITVFGQEITGGNWRVAISTFLDGIREKNAAATANPAIFFSKTEEGGAFLEIRFDFETNQFIFRGKTFKEVGPESQEYSDATIPIVGNDPTKIISALHQLTNTHNEKFLVVIFLNNDRRVVFWKDGAKLDLSATIAPT